MNEASQSKDSPAPRDLENASLEEESKAHGWDGGGNEEGGHFSELCAYRSGLRTSLMLYTLK